MSDQTNAVIVVSFVVNHKHISNSNTFSIIIKTNRYAIQFPSHPLKHTFKNHGVQLGFLFYCNWPYG